MNSAKLLDHSLKILSTIAIIVMVLISLVIYHADILDLLIFAFFIITFVYLPGIFLTRITDINFPNLSSFLLVSFCSGWILIVAEYFLRAYTGISLYYANPFLSLILIFYTLKGNGASLSKRFVSFSKIPTSVYVFVALIMLYVLLNTQYQYMSPELSASITASNDKVYQMGLIYSLSHGYPLVDPYVSGLTVYYHIFTQVLFSVPVSLFGMEPDFIVMSGCPYLTVYLFCLSMYSMFRHFCKHKERAGLYSLSFVLAHQLIARSIHASYLFRILLINENYGGFAIASSVSWLIVLDYYCGTVANSNNSRRLRISTIALLTAMIILTTGIKAPVGLVIVGGIVGTCILGLVLKKSSYTKLLSSSLFSVTGFFLVYKFLLSLDGTSGVGSNSIIGFGEITGICFWKPGLVAAMKDAGLPLIIRLAIIFALFSLLFFSIYFLPFVVGYIRELVLVIRGYKEYDIARVTVYASSLVGFILMFLLRYEGHSQIYFGTTTAVFSSLIAFWFLEDIESKSSATILYRATLIVMSLFLVVSVSTLVGEYKDLIPKAVEHSNPESTFNKYKSLSSDEYKGVMWIKENTHKNDLIATQMYASVNYDDYDIEDRWKSCHFLYAAYSGRNYYLEGSGYSFTLSDLDTKVEMIRNTKALYDPSNQERGKLAKELGVNYVFVTSRLYPVGDLSSDEYTRVFSNNDVEIYRID